MKKLISILLAMSFVLVFSFSAMAEEMTKIRKVFYGSAEKPIRVVLPMMQNVQVNGSSGIVFWNYSAYSNSWNIVGVENGVWMPDGLYEIHFSYENESIDLLGEISLDAVYMTLAYSDLNALMGFFPEGKEAASEIRKLKSAVRNRNYEVSLVTTAEGLEITDNFVRATLSSSGDVMIYPLDAQGQIDVNNISQGEKGTYLPSGSACWVVLLK